MSDIFLKGMGGPTAGTPAYLNIIITIALPAGVAHKNLGAENSVSVIGAYPDVSGYDINYGKPAERPGTDENIIKVLIPESDPVLGADKGLIKLWK
jgi:uncharacterized protein YjlB